MKLSLFLTVLLSALCLSINAQTVFQRTFGTAYTESGTKVSQTDDNGYILLSSAYDSASGFAYIVRTDSDGNKIWSKNITGVINNPKGIIQTQDGGYLLYGGPVYVNNESRPYLIKLDSNGNIVWQKFYDWNNTNSAYFNDVKEAIDGSGYIAVGNDYGYYVLISKFNLSGDMVWGRSMKQISYTDLRAGGFVQLTSDSCFYVVSKYRYGPYDEEILLSKFSKNGNGIWTKSISVSGMYTAWPHSGLSIKEMYNGNIMIGFFGGTDCLDLVEVDTSGASVSNAIRYNLPLYPTTWIGWDFAEPTINKSLYISASIYQNGTLTLGGLTDIVLSKTDTSGNVLWTKQIGGRNLEEVNEVITSTDGGAVLIGNTKSFSAGLNDVYLIKTDSVMTFSCNAYPSVSHVVQFPTSSSSNYGSEFASTNITTIFSNYIATNSNDTSYDACGCVPPRADFFTDYPNQSGSIEDNSTWATNWLWDYGNGQTDTSVAPFPEYTSEGVYTVCLKVSNACGEDSICHPINYIWIIISTPEDNYNSDIKAYPNPATTEITVSGYSPAYLKLCNAVGQTVAESKSNKIYVGNLSQGLYVLQLFDANGQQVKTEKVIVAK